MAEVTLRASSCGSWLRLSPTLTHDAKAKRTSSGVTPLPSRIRSEGGGYAPSVQKFNKSSRASSGGLQAGIGGLRAGFLDTCFTPYCKKFASVPEEVRRGRIVGGAPRRAVRRRECWVARSGESVGPPLVSGRADDKEGFLQTQEPEMNSGGDLKDEGESSILPSFAANLVSSPSLDVEGDDRFAEEGIGREDEIEEELIRMIAARGKRGSEDEWWEKVVVEDPKVAERHPVHQAVLQYSRWLAEKAARYGVVFSSTAAVTCTAAELIGTGDFSSPIVSGWLGGFVVGAFISSAAIWRFKLNSTQRNVVITGSTRGLGKALAREFLRFGDNVVVASRSEEAVRRTIAELRKEILEDGLGQPTKRDYSWRNRKREAKPHRVVGRACDVADSTDVRQLAEFARRNFGHVDIWINNAGQNPGAKSLLEFADEEIISVVSTNLMGSLNCTKEAIHFMRSQPTGGHVFNMDGNGSGGNATPQYAVYGATKCALRQLQQTLLRETASSKVGVHTASPGMVLTELLLAGATLSNKQAFNFICEQPETVAKALVPRLRRVRGTGVAVNYLTPPRVLLALALAWFRRGRWFDAEGRAVYAAEAERLRTWGEPKRPSPEAAAMELVPASAWLCLNCSSLICLYLVLQNMTSS